MAELKLCETGAAVSAHISVRIKCATSDAAVVKTSFEEPATAAATADLDRCTVLDINVQAQAFIARAGLSIANVNEKLRMDIEKEIKPYCTNNRARANLRLCS